MQHHSAHHPTVKQDSDQPTRALSTHLSTVRARNRAEARRLHAIDNVVERLEFWGIFVLQGQEVSTAHIRDHATAIVDAVLALTREAVH